jgi:osmotically-inducible protein OsmY
MRTALAMGTVALTFCLFGCTETERSDVTIASEVERELAEEGIGGNIDVVARAGVVTLSGSVADAEAKGEAEDVAEDIDGVSSVVNNLRTTMAGDAPAHIDQPPAGAPPPARGF